MPFLYKINILYNSGENLQNITACFCGFLPLIHNLMFCRLSDLKIIIYQPPNICKYFLRSFKLCVFFYKM